MQRHCERPQRTQTHQIHNTDSIDWIPLLVRRIFSSYQHASSTDEATARYQIRTSHPSGRFFVRSSHICPMATTKII
ncbi:hypothetical protein FJTKL_03857 [Diaporthe vaccinii]|uniref:SH2 domain-containing protein n=1 Tax=Diaporthe vaccinii TaxID=105482 RepID=A0ABR4F1B8_9PEZI